ncbi:Uu.00g126180.m01.CDS01 [Anthostomella pinea]|uniref:Uu.00g126180.m01.CDS01 n=1 Tax=Anthostomella pinea TaxID=933095 RepID=A0AAI8VHU4_9PEZI|nr:Uu.00g126180.m01.CDS01 [Anthostomella pinea]
MPSNTAAFIPEAGKPREVKPAPYPIPGEHEMIVENRSIGLNMADWAMGQTFATSLFPDLKFPLIGGEDVSGDVVAVGLSVTGFKVGDRITGSSQSAFQKYPLVAGHLAFVIPDSLSYEQASVLPLFLCTALVPLFHKEYLGLQLPSLTPNPTGKTLLIWGGSTGVGSSAIQLAVAAGYEVITTASPRNFDNVKQLGASQVFDYNSGTINEDLVAAFKGKTLAGSIAIAGFATGTYGPILDACAAVATSTEGSNFVALTMRPPKNIPASIETKFVNAYMLLDDKEIGYAIFRDYLPKALAAGSFTAAPKAEVVGNGLESIHAGLETLAKGVSAKRLAITL